MTPPPIVRREAQRDIDEAAVWYEGERAGLGLQFLDELDVLLRRVADSPFQFPNITAHVRRALLHRFPYGVYFLHSDQTVEVIAVLHLHRHPDTWKRRQT